MHMKSFENYIWCLLSSDKTGELIVAGTFDLSTPCPVGAIVALLPDISCHCVY